MLSIVLFNFFMNLPESIFINPARQIKSTVFFFNNFNKRSSKLFLLESLIKTLKIFRWLKSQGISDQEMLKTFNCGVGFCLIVKHSNYKKVIRLFPKKYKPYVIGKITKNSEKVKLSGKVVW